MTTTWIFTASAVLSLVEIERDPQDRYAREFRLRKRPLLDQFVRFQV